MISSHKEFLSQFGWDEFYQTQLNQLEKNSFRPARIIGEERGLYRLQFDRDQTIWSSISGKMQFNALSRKDYPVIGDWVLADIPESSDKGVIHFVFNRKSTLQRKQGTAEVQILSSNVNYVFITTSLNGDLNFGRLDRYMVFAWDSGAMPVILLTKTDRFEGDMEALIAEITDRFPGVNIHALTNENFEEADFLEAYLRPGSTAVLVGSSGVGKSTLTNYLTGKISAKTQDVRADDDKGRHTTTSRSLYESIFGGLIIDTPGMRGLSFEADAESFSKHFGDVEELVALCRFSDCKHTTEPDCMIRNSLEDGSLDPGRYKNYCKLLGEIRHSLRRQDKALYAQDKKLWKKGSILARQNFKPNR
jgi:ribosome biogenesis GTPase